MLESNRRENCGVTRQIGEWTGFRVKEHLGDITRGKPADARGPPAAGVHEVEYFGMAAAREA